MVRGSNAVFECQASGVPRPDTSWEYYNPISMTTNAIVSDGVNYTVTEMTDSSSERLRMSTLTVLATDTADFGMYRCVTTNVVAMASVNATLTIHGEYYSFSPMFKILYSGYITLNSFVSSLEIQFLGFNFRSNSNHCACMFMRELACCNLC